MKEAEDFGKWFFESSIEEMKEKGAESNEYAIGLLRAFEDANERYQRYCPLEKIKEGIKLIKEDQHFKQPEAIKDKSGKIDKQVLFRKLDLLLWESRIKKKFILYGFLKASTEVIKEHFSNEKSENKILGSHLLMVALYKIYKLGTQNYSSLTANSIDQSKAPSLKIPSVDILMQQFEPVIKILDRSSQSGKIAGWDENKTLNFQTYLVAMDMSVIERDIFHGIQEAFEITKLNKGEQSERYKILLLWHLFKHSHPHLYHTKGSSDGARTQDDLNREALLKLITKPGSEFFE